MRGSYETLLLLGVLGFYLYDSVLWLHADELVVFRAGVRWRFACPGGDWRLAGRIPYLPNPLTPWRPAFRARWALPKGASSLTPEADDPALAALLAALRSLRWPLGGLMALLFVLLPAVLLGLGTGMAFLLTVFATYVWIVSLLVVVVRWRANFGLDRRALVSLAFDVLACPPFALNLVRKLSLRATIDCDPVALARGTLETEALAEFLRGLATRLDMELQAEAPDSPRGRVLRSYLDEIAGSRS